MKIYCGILVFILMSCTGNKEADFFIGQVNYSYQYESDQLNTDSLRSEKPWESKFRYGLENYQSRFIGKDTFTYFYSGNLNKCLSMQHGILDSLCEDYGKDTDSVMAFKIYDTDEKVLGYACKVLEYQSKLFRTKYYVSKNLKIAPATYKKHRAYNWSFYGEKAGGGLILKIEHWFNKYYMYGIATSVKPFQDKTGALEIDENLFHKMCVNQ